MQFRQKFGNSRSEAAVRGDSYTATLIEPCDRTRFPARWPQAYLRCAPSFAKIRNGRGGVILLLARVPERVGWQFSETAICIRRQPAELPETVASSDLVTVVPAGCCRAELGAPDSFAQQQVSLGLILSCSWQQPAMSGPIPRSPCTAPGYKPVHRDLPQPPAEAAHDQRVLPQRRPVVANLAVPETGDHRFDQCLLETVRGLGIGNTAGASSASCPAAACRRWSFAIADDEGVRINMSRAGIRSRPATSVTTEAMSSIGSDMAP